MRLSLDALSGDLEIRDQRGGSVKLSPTDAEALGAFLISAAFPPARPSQAPRTAEDHLREHRRLTELQSYG